MTTLLYCDDSACSTTNNWVAWVDPNGSPAPINGPWDAEVAGTPTGTIPLFIRATVMGGFQHTFSGMSLTVMASLC